MCTISLVINNVILRSYRRQLRFNLTTCNKQCYSILVTNNVIFMLLLSLDVPTRSQRPIATCFISTNSNAVYYFQSALESTLTSHPSKNRRLTPATLSSPIATAEKRHHLHRRHAAAARCCCCCYLNKKYTYTYIHAMLSQASKFFRGSLPHFRGPLYPAFTFFGGPATRYPTPPHIP
jgi:hypothetical protein